jgi:hypothetical protein
MKGEMEAVKKNQVELFEKNYSWTWWYIPVIQHLGS